MYDAGAFFMSYPQSKTNTPMHIDELAALGSWRPGKLAPAFEGSSLLAAISRVREPLHVIRHADSGAVGVALGGEVDPRPPAPAGTAARWLATLPALYPEWLGDRSFAEVHGVRFPYIGGEMANGIATTQMVLSLARAGMLGFFGAAGLGFAKVEAAVDTIQRELAGTTHSYGVNLIHSPNEPDLEHAVANMLVQRGVPRVCASAYMGLTKSVVRYAAAGLHVDAAGTIRRRHHVFAKISRPEVARRFLSPAPGELLSALVAAGELTAPEAQLAAQVPVAEDITVEADSGGHTDNRPLAVLLPLIRGVADELHRSNRYSRPIRVGAAGGLGTPTAVAAAFALGAAYVLTGSVNQAALESGLSAEGKKMLAEAGMADVMMAPAADMFELGVRVQVLRRGTMFGPRAARLYEVYTAHDSIEAIPPAERAQLEAQIFRMPMAEVWEDTKRFFQKRDPREIDKGEADPKHKLALICRWYLGRASRWAIDGDASRRADYQIWCGPAMGAFNEWARGSFLATAEERGVVQIALNLLEGAAVVTRAQQLRTYGVAVPAAAFDFRPRRLE
jgi:PfaD family protein